MSDGGMALGAFLACVFSVWWYIQHRRNERRTREKLERQVERRRRDNLRRYK